jgi:NitT/TauT family transport system permease protein
LNPTLKRLLYPPLGVLFTVLLWHWACVEFKIATVVLPTPVQVFEAGLRNWDLLIVEGWVTLAETLLGFGLALALGIPIAVAVTNSETLNLTFMPLLIALQSVPKVALAPIMLVWLGTGIESKLAIAWLVAFFPVVVDTTAGLQSTPRELQELARSLRASRWETFAKVQFPAALPFIVAGAKVAVTLAVIGAVIGEFIGSTAGLGYVLLSATSQFNTPLAFAALFALAVLGILAYALVAAAEFMLSPWLPPQTERSH